MPATVLNAEDVAAEIDRWYPAPLRRNGVQGTVVVKLSINATGKITYRSLYVSSGVHSFDRLAMRAAGRVKAAPATRGGVPVSSEMMLPIRFEGRDRAGPGAIQGVHLVDRDSLAARARERFPNHLRKAALTIYASVEAEVDSSGAVRAAALLESSCFRDVDRLTIDLVRAVRVSPPPPKLSTLNLIFTFRGDSLSLLAAGDTSAPRDTTSTADPPPSGPAIKPVLLNRDVVGGELVRRYPRDLMTRGIGGEVMVWILLDEEGRPIQRRVAHTSGICALDVAALEVTRVARFAPATVGGKPIKVWLQLPVIFRASP